MIFLLPGHRSRIAICLAAAAFLRAFSAHAAINVSDDRGREIILAAPATRIVSLAPHATELIFAAGAGDRLKGVTSFSDYPEAARKIPLVGDMGSINLEQLIKLQPDLVVAWKSGNRAADIEILEKRGIAVLVTEPRSLSDIPRLLRAIGVLAGSGKEAERSAADFERELGALKKSYGSRRPISVFYQIWSEPLMTVNGEHIISDVMSLCGGRNIFAALPALAGAVSAENVLAADPEAIIASGSLYGKERLWDEWRRFPRLKAVRNRHLFFIHPDIIQRPTPRMLQGARQMCEQLQHARCRAGGARECPPARRGG